MLNFVAKRIQCKQGIVGVIHICRRRDQYSHRGTNRTDMVTKDLNGTLPIWAEKGFQSISQ